MKAIAHVRTGFPAKFGIPRQSGLVCSLEGKVVFTPEFRHPDVVRGLEGFSHIWLIWQFHAAVRETWSPTVRPPRLGGEARMGVFATRSPFRPNNLGLSSVTLKGIELHPDLGPILSIAGVDMLDNTPIYDIKPYLAYTDSHPEATGGFTDALSCRRLEVQCSPEHLALLPDQHRASLIDLLAEDPRPSYHNDPERIYGFEFVNFSIKFKVQGSVLRVCALSPLPA